MHLNHHLKKHLNQQLRKHLNQQLDQHMKGILNNHLTQHLNKHLNQHLIKKSFDTRKRKISPLKSREIFLNGIKNKEKDMKNEIFNI